MKTEEVPWRIGWGDQFSLIVYLPIDIIIKVPWRIGWGDQFSLIVYLPIDIIIKVP